MIDVYHMTKKYGNGRGICDITFSVPEGEVFAMLGPNGAGKTTTIRHLMGFVRADEGECFINSLNCWDDAALISRKLGYVPASLVLPSDMTGRAYIDYQAKLRELKSMRRAYRLIDRFELDTSLPIGKMSGGNRQKLAIVCAFMHNPQVLILDEPSTGLDPLMKSRFTQLLLEEKDIGKTIFISSHIMDEIESTSDRIAMIRDGNIVSIQRTGEILSGLDKIYVVTFETYADGNAFSQMAFDSTSADGLTFEVKVHDDLTALLAALNDLHVHNLDIRSQNLEDKLLTYYEGAHA